MTASQTEVGGRRSDLHKLSVHFDTSVLEALFQGGLVTCTDVATATQEALKDALLGKGVSARDVKEAATALANGNLGFQTSAAVLEQQGVRRFLSTGSPNLDSILGGGLECGSMTEAAGEFGTGKTQLALNAAAIAAADGHKVLWFDTEYTYRAERVQEIAVSLGLDAAIVHKHIMVSRPINLRHQEKLLKDAWLEADRSPVSLVVVDSLMKHFAAEYGADKLIERQQHLNKHLHDIQRLAQVYDLAVYVTNPVRGGKQSLTDARFQTPSGGHIMAHASTHRLYLYRGRNGSRMATIIDSPNLPEGEAAFRIGREGLIDA